MIHLIICFIDGSVFAKGSVCSVELNDSGVYFDYLVDGDRKHMEYSFNAVDKVLIDGIKFDASSVL